MQSAVSSYVADLSLIMRNVSLMHAVALFAAKIYRPVQCGTTRCEYTNQCVATQAGFDPRDCQIKGKWLRTSEADSKQVSASSNMHTADGGSLGLHRDEGIAGDKNDKSLEVRFRPGKCPSVASGVMCSK